MEGALDPDAARRSTSGGTCCATSASSTAIPTPTRRSGSRATTRPAMQDQAALGPEAGLAIPAEDGGVELIVSTQWLHVDRQQVAPALNLPEDKVRITLAGVGGAFGSREDLHMQLHACLLALHTGRPVKMSYGRAESFLAHVHRHPSRSGSAPGATRDGRLVADPGTDRRRRRRVRVVLAGGDRERDHLPGRPVRGPERATRGHRRVHEQPALRRDARLRRAAGRASRTRRTWTGSPASSASTRSSSGCATSSAPGSVLPTGQVIRGSAPLREVVETCRDLPMPPEPEPAAQRNPMTFPGGAGNVGRGEGLAARGRFRGRPTRTSRTARASTTSTRRA